MIYWHMFSSGAWFDEDMGEWTTSQSTEWFADRFDISYEAFGYLYEIYGDDEDNYVDYYYGNDYVEITWEKFIEGAIVVNELEDKFYTHEMAVDNNGTTLDGFAIDQIGDDMTVEQFLSYDVNYDNIVDLDEFITGDLQLKFFKDVLSTMWMSAVLNEDASEYFGFDMYFYDKDNSGFIDQEEYYLTTSELMPFGQEQNFMGISDVEFFNAYYAITFEEADIDQNGVVSMEEVLSIGKEANMDALFDYFGDDIDFDNMTLEDLEYMLTELDINMDDLDFSAVDMDNFNFEDIEWMIEDIDLDFEDLDDLEDLAFTDEDIAQIEQAVADMGIDLAAYGIDLSSMSDDEITALLETYGIDEATMMVQESEIADILLLAEAYGIDTSAYDLSSMTYADLEQMFNDLGVDLENLDVDDLDITNIPVEESEIAEIVALA